MPCYSLAESRSNARSILVIGVSVGFVVQIFHFLEHVLQAGYWIVFPERAPWITPWIRPIRNSLGLGGRLQAGDELLHLIGNALFLVTLLGALALFRSPDGRDFLAPLRIAAAVQGWHVFEHVLLTSTYFIRGKPVGLTNGFCLLQGADGRIPIIGRLWLHFLINAVVTLLALYALRRRAVWRVNQDPTRGNYYHLDARTH